MFRGYFLRCIGACFCFLMLLAAATVTWAGAPDLPEIRKIGVLRHIGRPYAAFNTGMGDGLSVELVQRFAASLGVGYAYVPLPWKEMFSQVTGKNIVYDGKTVRSLGTVPVRGDLIATGCTVLPWRTQVVAFSIPTFPTQVWLMARTDSSLRPIVPSGNIQSDIGATKSLLTGYRVFVKSEGCLNPAFYHLEKFGALPVEFEGNLNELVPAVLEGRADATLIDLPDALIALRKWPGQVKVLGPVSPVQDRAVAFRKDSPLLLQAFNGFLTNLKKSGEYEELVEKYYPDVRMYFPDFFR